MKSNYEKVKNCGKISLFEDNKLKYKNSEKVGVGLELIGFDKEGDLLAVSDYDWEVIKITKDLVIEEMGRIDHTLADVKDNPDLLLDENTKLMSLRDIEKALGHKVILANWDRWK